MNYARMIGDVAAEVFCAINDLTGEALLPADVFPPDLAASFVQVPDDVKPGWVRGADGNFSAPQAPEPQAPTPAPAPGELALLLRRQSEVLIDDHINRQAQAMGYDGIVSAVSYAEEPAVPRFQQEGAALRAWRSQVYARAYAIHAEVLAGKRPAPSPVELIGLLPVFVPPAV